MTIKRIIPSNMKQDYGLSFSDGTPLVRMPITRRNLRSGQYTFDKGIFTFSSRDANKQVYGIEEIEEE